MILTMILVSCTPLLLISAIIGYQFETSYHEKVVAYLKELVQKHEQIIDGFLHEKRTFFEKAMFKGDVEDHVQELKQQTGVEVSVVN